MHSVEWLLALAALGRRVPAGTAIVLAGSGALALTGQLPRDARDLDVLESSTPWDDLLLDVFGVAAERGLDVTWMSNSAEIFQRELPQDYGARLTLVGQFGNLTVRALARQDVLLMKCCASRPGLDDEDLALLHPTADEWAFIAAQLPRLVVVAPDKGENIRARLIGARVVTAGLSDELPAGTRAHVTALPDGPAVSTPRRRPNPNTR